MPDRDDKSAQLARAVAALADALGVSPAHLAEALALGGDEREPDLATLVAHARTQDASLRRHAPYLRVLLDGLPAYEPVDGPPQPAMPGLGPLPPSAVAPTALRDLQRAVGRYAATKTLRDAEEHDRQLPSYDPDAHGHGAQRNFQMAVRAVFSRDEIGRWTIGNPAEKLTVPSGGASHVFHMTATQFLAWLAIGCTTGRDRDLDRLLLLTLRHTALRQEGLLNLTLDGIDPLECTMRSSAKNGRIQVLPVNRQLLDELVDLAHDRGARRGRDRVFRFRDGTPMTGRRFDTLSVRLKQHEPWAAPLTIGPHTIRRLTLTEIAQRFNRFAAIAWGGHSWRGREAIDRYLREPTPEELRPIPEALFGPLDGPLLPGLWRATRVRATAPDRGSAGHHSTPPSDGPAHRADADVPGPTPDPWWPRCGLPPARRSRRAAPSTAIPLRTRGARP